MLLRTGFIEPCLPSPAERPPVGPGWVHEIKHDGYRLMARRDGAGVRLLTRNGHDWTLRFPLIAQAVGALRVISCLIDGEAVACDDDGLPVFDRLRQRRHDRHVFLHAFSGRRDQMTFCIGRREFIALLGGAVAAWPLAARAQQSSPALIGFLNAGAATILKEEIDAFREGLRSLGHIEGRNVRFEYRFADGYLDRLPALAAELIRLNPNVVVSSPVPANLAIAKATNTIPIVMASGADPVGFGLVQSLSHPGGNVTGLTNFAEELV